MRITVLDFETDPFAAGQMVRPFLAGFYDGEKFISWWNTNCVKQLVNHLLSIDEPMIIYAHNGGRFDFFYMLPLLSAGPMTIINNRIVKALLGPHQLRDSFAIMPFPLEDYKKTKIDYQIFTAAKREENREQIISYLRDDCVDLHTLCIAFHEEFGDYLTIGSASMAQLKKFHKFSCGGSEYDEKFRTSFYYGGRNQVFASGIRRGEIKVYDVNSMYPFAMHSYLHPIGTGVSVSKYRERNTTFIVVKGKNDGAFPTRHPDGSLDFTVPYGTFSVSVHEFDAAIETGAFRPHKILKTYGHRDRGGFDSFVDHFFSARAKAKLDNDTIRTLFYKFVLNSAYGKFAQNPDRYFDWRIEPVGSLPPEWHECTEACSEDCPAKWSPAWLNEEYIIWQRPLSQKFYYNIATGASITGAARAVLLRGLRATSSPLYCDTDSIISSSLTSVTESDSTLGGWKLEAIGTMAAICGKKLYAIFDEKIPPGHKCIKGQCEKPCPLQWCIKKAHKGARLDGDQILDIAKGGEIETANPVPTFKFDGTWKFQTRRIKRTA